MLSRKYLTRKIVIFCRKKDINTITYLFFPDHHNQERTHKKFCSVVAITMGLGPVNGGSTPPRTTTNFKGFIRKNTTD